MHTHSPPPPLPLLSCSSILSLLSHPVQLIKSKDVEFNPWPRSVATQHSVLVSTEATCNTYSFSCSPFLCLPDPIQLIKSKDVKNVRAAIGVMVNSAKILSTLTVARALYECKNGAEAQLSNELFHQWAQGLIDASSMHSAVLMNFKLESLCLNGPCSEAATTALMAITKELAAIKVSVQKLLGW